MAGVEPDRQTLELRRIEPADNERLVKLVFTVMREFGIEPDPEGVDADIFAPGEHYIAAGGEFQVLVDPAGTIVGCFGVMPLENGNCELRKMYLEPEQRGRGLGKKMLAKAMGTAAELGFKTMQLETSSRMNAAIALYEAHGFLPVDPCGTATRCDRVYAKSL